MSFHSKPVDKLHCKQKKQPHNLANFVIAQWIYVGNSIKLFIIPYYFCQRECRHDLV